MSEVAPGSARPDTDAALLEHRRSLDRGLAVTSSALTLVRDLLAETDLRPAVTLAALLLAAPAHAIDAHGFSLGTASGDPAAFTRLGDPRPGEAGAWDAGVVLDYAEDPLAEALPTGRDPILDRLLSANLAFGTRLAGLALDLQVPMHLGSDPAGGFVATGDTRLGVTFPFAQPRGVALALVGGLRAPTGADAHYVGTGPGALAAVSAGGDLGRIGWIAMMGAQVGLPDEERNLRTGAGPVAGAGVAWRATDALSAAFELSTEGDVGFAAAPIEATLSSRVRLPMGAWATAGAAAGVGDGVGASRWRAFAGIGFSHRPPEPVAVVMVDPNADRDGDGIPDAADDCPDQAETFDGFTDEDGCPELDGDGDGVSFERDKCPREAILPEQDPRWSDGCPKVAEFAGDRIAITEAIFFREARAELLPSSTRVLEAVRDVIVAHPEIGYFLVEGHTNPNGSEAYNLRLSDARAFAVMQWLAAHGVASDRLVSKGFGESRPLVPPSHPDALAINRRVEFRILRVEELPADSRRIELPPEVRP